MGAESQSFTPITKSELFVQQHTSVFLGKLENQTSAQNRGYVWTCVFGAIGTEERDRHIRTGYLPTEKEEVGTEWLGNSNTPKENWVPEALSSHEREHDSLWR